MPAPKSGQVFSRIVVPFVLFLLVVGGVAWLIQYLPNFRRNSAEQEITSSAPELLRFVHNSAVWPEQDLKDYLPPEQIGEGDKDSKEYFPEYEAGQSGHYDFPVDNISGKEIEVGLLKANCTCSDVSIALFPLGSTDADTSKLTWSPLKQSGKKSGDQPPDLESVVIPVGARGLVRLGWKIRDMVSKSIRIQLNATLWSRPKGAKETPQMQTLFVPLRQVPPVMFFPDQLDLPSFRGEISERIICWSPTRDLSVEAAAGRSHIAIDAHSIDPGFEFKLTPLTDTELAAFRKELGKNKVPSRVKSALRIEVNVYERRNDAYLDQGHFKSNVPLLLDGERYAYKPSVSGYILSDVRIHGCEDGRIRMGNIEREGKKKSFTILADPARTMLTLAAVPTNVDVSLSVRRDEDRRYWQLDVHVPPNTPDFPPAQNAILLRTQPTRFYLAQIVSAMGNTATGCGFSQVGALPDIAGFASVITSWGIEARQTRIPVMGVAVSSR